MKFLLHLKAWAVFLLCLLPFLVHASDTLTVDECRLRALKNSPLQQKKLLAESIGLLQIHNIRSNSLPRIQLGAQASWQSDVFGLPFQFPNSEIPIVPKDQYRLTLDVAQRIWDGGSDRYLRQQRGLEQDLAIAQADVDAFSIREIVTDLYFRVLLLQESEAILNAAQKDLDTRFKQATAAVTEGVVLRTSADQIKIQILKNQQQVAATQSDYQAVLAILAKWVGQKVIPTLLSPRSAGAQSSVPGNTRPEYTLFILQQRGYQIGKNALELRAQPRIEAFAQGGIGRPNPFNFFETGFEPFFLLGLRAVWTPVDWGNRHREAQVFDLQMKNVDAQRQFFEQRLSANTLKDQQDEAKWQAQLAQDDAIITLQKDIIRRAEAQVQNGVMTTTDYLAQLNLLTQAELTRKTHEVQAMLAAELQRAKLGD